MVRTVLSSGDQIRTKIKIVKSWELILSQKNKSTKIEEVKIKSWKYLHWGRGGREEGRSMKNTSGFRESRPRRAYHKTKREVEEVSKQHQKRG